MIKEFIDIKEKTSLFTFTPLIGWFYFKNNGRYLDYTKNSLMSDNIKVAMDLSINGSLEEVQRAATTITGVAFDLKEVSVPEDGVVYLAKMVVKSPLEKSVHDPVNNTTTTITIPVDELVAIGVYGDTIGFVSFDTNINSVSEDQIKSYTLYELAEVV